ncbi:unnamed protein product [Moneuplotes crassus]|uniref:Uncharacterized protein n=1 Tax=Euplotes crassus TaxID=5936 RepID=A0AAD1Y6M1_EUPCR|nr:unnamed protein product [Moneuplotes crassus]
MESNSLDTTQAQDRPATNGKNAKNLPPVQFSKDQHKTIQPPPKEVELQFRVFSYSSQEDEGTAENLSLNGDIEGNPGWHSQRFCQYPQELIIYFNSPVKLSKLVLLSHQNKIASQVDLYSYHPSFENAISASKYKRLGKFSLDENSKSNYQARESKSVYLDTECQYLKFIFSQCHVNRYNIFNQVSVQSIRCYGSILKQDKKKSLGLNMGDYKDMTPTKDLASNGLPQKISKFYNDKSSLNNRLSSLSDKAPVKPLESRDNSFIGMFFDDKLLSLKKEEEKALFEDDFDQLKQVRSIMKSISKAKKKLNVLSVQKVQAIGNEDYETAQMIKNEMSKIQKNILTTNDRNGKRNVLNALNKGRGTTLSPIEYRSRASRKESKAQSSMNINDSYATTNTMGKPLNPIAIKSMKKIEIPPENDIFAPKKIGLDERALPALGRETPIDFSKVNEEEFEHQKPDQINSSKITLKVDPRHVSHLEKLTNIFGEDLAKKVCADKWYYQQEGIEFTVKGIKDKLENQSDEDKTRIIQFLSDIISDYDSRAKNNVSRTGKGTKQKKNIKNLKKRVELFLSLAEESNNLSEKYLNDVCKRLPHFVDHTDLKSEYIKCLQEVYKTYGYPLIEPVVSSLLIPQLEQIKTIIPEAKQVLKEKVDQKDRKKEQIMEEKKRIDVEPAKNAFSSRRKSNIKSRGQDRKFMCEFCEKFDEGFADEDNKDLHYLEDCPKLTSCPGCEQIIEKTSLDNHLLQECKEKDK